MLIFYKTEKCKKKGCILKNWKNSKKTVDVRENYAIIFGSAIKLPKQLNMHNTQLEGG